MSSVQTRDEASCEIGEDAPEPGAVLIFSEGLPELRPIPVRAAPVVLGRDDAGGLPLTDERASRRHAELTFDAGRFVVRDLESRNGTTVDGVRIQGSIGVVPPAVLRIGSSIFVLRGDLRPFERFAIDALPDLVSGPALRDALERVGRAARAGAGLLITGESGTGKELAARAFHASGPRARGPFVAVNCAAIPEGVAERLLFGARRGAFSGATADVTGYVQEAHGGTLFLDEMGELDLAVQAKLLRVIETHEVLPLGASRGTPVDVRICSATHRDLRRAAEDGRFRADLYYRIGLPEVRLPPLRERVEEIPWLIAHALASLPVPLRVDARLVETCVLRPWPGNVRELLAEVRRAAHDALETSARALLVEHLGPSAGRRSDEPSSGPPAQPEPHTREAIEAALAEHGGNVAAAARALGLHRTQLYRHLKRHGLEVARAGAAGADTVSERPR
ncbi:MAG: sigma 54-interacting transcriptional regulator [Byssovorax sp.]